MDACVERHVAPELRDVDVGQVGIDLPLPCLHVAAAHRKQGLAELAAQGEAVAPPRRRRGIEPQRVAPRAVARDELHVGQQQWFSAVTFVGPAHGAALNDEFTLAEEPVGGPRFAGGVGRHVEARDVQLAFGVESDFELRAFDVELLEVGFPERARRHARDHARQPQCVASLGVFQHHVAQLKGREQPVRLRGDTTDANRYPDDLGGLCLKGSTVLADSRHNPYV